MDVKIIRPDTHQQDVLGVTQWDLWTIPVSSFEWLHDVEERCFIALGEAKITHNGETLPLHAGDLVTFPAGYQVTWEIMADIKIYYKI